MKAQLRHSTYSSYAKNIELHINPRIGHIALQKLQPEDLDTLYAQLLSDGKRNGAGGGLAPKTVRIIHGIIRKALADAHRKGTVNRNVADLADPPKVRLGGRTAMKVWSAEELRRSWPASRATTSTRRSSSSRTPGCGAARCSG